MKISKPAMSGTLESSDVQVTIEPMDSGLEIQISSDVINQYGRQIKALVLKTLESLGVESAKVTLIDKGALDCTIIARTECAVYRASDFKGDIPWGCNA